MKVEKYPLKAGSELNLFDFVSEGLKGAIQKLILFQETEITNFYNLAFGDKDPVTGDINDLAVSNNLDTEKVLRTVVAALYAFLIIFRMRLYMPPAVHLPGQGFTEWV